MLALAYRHATPIARLCKLTSIFWSVRLAFAHCFSFSASSQNALKPVGSSCLPLQSAAVCLHLVRANQLQ